MPRPELTNLSKTTFAVLLLVAVLALTGAGTAQAGDDPASNDATTSTSTPAGADPDIIPRPNSGQAPEEAGDRGGALQLGLLALVVVAVASIVALVVRESRRARARARPGRFG